MLKSARYFFLIFIITTVIPLVLMFTWTNKRLDAMRSLHSKNFAEIGKKELQTALDAYIDGQQGKFLVSIRGLDLKKTSSSDLQKILSPARAEIVYGHNLPKIVSYYELQKTNQDGAATLCSVVLIPFENSKNKSLRVSHEIDFDKMQPFGPFAIELYSGNQVSEQNFLGRVKSPHMPPPMYFDGHSPGQPPLPSQDELPIYRDKTLQYSGLQLFGENGDVVATFAIKPHKMPMPMEARFFENNFGIVILIFGSALSLFMAFYIQKTFMTPLMRLSEASARIQDGDFDINLKTDVKNKEIRHTFSSFNKMCKELKEKEELRKSFIVNLTHDLRTPLIAQERSLSMIAQCFKKLELNAELELSESLEKNNQHLLRMVNLILESYCFDAKNVTLVYSDINLASLVDSSYEKIRSLALEKEILLENNISSGFLPVRADEISMKRVLVNLVSNSIENLSPGGDVKISAELEGDSASIFVEDNGCGIAIDDITHIFDRYYSGKSLERKLGSGLGLDVCKKLIELHNGTISVESKLNAYTKFTIKLPIKEQV